MEFLYLKINKYKDMKSKVRIKYESIKDFSKKAGISSRTVYRFYNKNSDLFGQAILKGSKRYLPLEHLKYFSSEIMFDENKLLQSENNSMRNLINCLVDKNSLPARLWYMEWTFFFTIAYKAERNKKSCFRLMNEIYDLLEAKYGDDTDLRMFFTTEPFNNRKGFHNHFTLYVEDVELRAQIVSEIQAFFSYDRVDVDIYDKFKAGLFYISKNGLVNEDWDILGNNLEGKIIKDAS
jgi:hypothetical protein